MSLTQPKFGSMVSLRNICKTSSPDSVSEVVLLSDFNLEILPGQFVSVVDSNGSGKTAMLNLICGSIMPDSGSILLKGEDISRRKEFQRSKSIGRVFQDPAKGTCPELTILENMAFADNKDSFYGLSRGVSRCRTDEYHTMLQCLDLGLEDKLSVQVGSLSGGQRQTLALLISTMTSIDLLTLDEHTAALNSRPSGNVVRLAQKLVTEKHLTTLVVTHNLKYLIQYGNRLLMMHQGQAVIDATDETKEALPTDDLLNRFNQISLEVGN